MASSKKMIILPFDGLKTGEQVLTDAEKVLAEPGTSGLVGYAKTNDVLFVPDMSSPALVKAIMNLPSKPEIMLDTKSADVWGTVKNIGTHFADCPPAIMTIYSNVNGMGFVQLRRVLPRTKLALVSALTDSTPDQIVRQYGHFPDTKILHDVRCKQREYEEAIELLKKKGEDVSNLPPLAFDAIVCSPLELEFLSTMFGYRYWFIVPGIRDIWMEVGQQARSTGVLKAIRMGATLVVMGAQMTKGNSAKGVSAEESRRLTAVEISKADIIEVVPDHIATLFNCDGYYASPKDATGRRLGPLVGYAGKYDLPDGSRRNYVGETYYNFAKAEQHPRVCDHYARDLAKMIRDNVGEIDVLIAAPMGGLYLTADTSRHLNCRRIFAEKKIIRLADESAGIKEESELIIKRHDIRLGDRVGVTEDVCNNFSTTSNTKSN